MQVNYDPSFNDLPEIVPTDHPLSLGYTVRLATCHKVVGPELAGPKDAVNAFAEQVEGCDGFTATWGEHGTIVVYVASDYDDGPLRVSRFIAVLVHELSHVLDGFIERAHVSTVDTEIRAYYLDWMLERVLVQCPHLSPRLMKRKTKHKETI